MLETTDNNQKRNELNFIYKLLQSKIRPRIEEFVKKRIISGPLIVEFDPTTACNFKCQECINKELLNKGEIKHERILELISEFYITGVKGIIFTGGGEPLMHMGIAESITYAHELGMSIGLKTNGILISRYLEIISQCVSWVRVSVDAATPATFSVFRPSHITNSFQKVISNMERLSKYKKGKLGYSFLLIERIEEDDNIVTNCHELLQAAKLAKNIGCDYFEFKPAVDKYHHLITFSKNMKNCIEKQLRELQNLNTDNFHIIFPKSIKYLLTSSSPDQPKTYTTCPVLELRTLVTPNGIYPCPYKRGDNKNLIGSPNEKFDYFWSSKERINKIKRINPSIDCQFYCIRHDINIFLDTLFKAYSEEVDLLSYLIQTEIADDIFI